MNQIMC